MAYVIRLGDGSNERIISREYQADAMADAVSVLIDHFHLFDHISLPYIMRKKAVLSSSPTHPSGSNMRSHRLVGEDVFLNTDLPGRTKVTQIQRMASDCDVNVSFEGWPTYEHEN